MGWLRDVGVVTGRCDDGRCARRVAPPKCAPMTRMTDAEEIEALKRALAAAEGELRVLRTERDLLQEQLNRYKRQLFAASSEAGNANQKDLFFNEAEVEGAKAQPVAEEADDDHVDVP